MKTQSMNPNESLRLITDTILRTKSDIRQNSFYFLLWGWLVIFSSILNFILIKYMNSPLHFLPWPVLMTIGAIATVVYGYKSGQKSSTESYVNNFMKYLWIVLGLSFFIIVFLCLQVHTSPTPFTLILAGAGTLISGLVMKFKPLVFGGVVFFLASVASVFLGESDQLLINAVAIGLGYLIPAYILKSEKE